MEELKLTKTWDKVFPKSELVSHKKVTFHNRYGITLAADMYIPKNAKGKISALAVCGPFGAVKEQSSGLYAQTLAERGFLTIAFDPSFTGESEGTPRYVASPDINTEDFCAAVDFLSNLENVDAEKIGIVGICGWGGMALNAAAIDTRIKATVASTMYDMSRVSANGYFDEADNAKARFEMKQKLNAQRTIDYKNGTYARAGGVVDPLPKDAPFFVKDYYDYYKTKRGYHKRSLNSNDGWNVTSSLSFINMPILSYSNEIKSAVLLIHGDKAHSCYFSKDAFKKLKGKNKELLLIKGAVHTDLYDRMDIIPFDKIAKFFNENLKQEKSGNKKSKLNVLNTEQTLDYILKNKCSISRFGDAEFSVMVYDKGIDYQHSSPELKAKLFEIKTTPKCLACIPDIFNPESFNAEKLTKVEYKHWSKRRFGREKKWAEIFGEELLGDAFISRFYIRYKDHSHTAEFVEKLKKLWDKRDILFVEGKKTRLGVGNDLFSNAKSIRRILCPSKEAFNKLEEIEKAILDNSKSDTLVICALGATASVIAYELADKLQVLDLGHIDIEYEWFLRNATKRIPIEGKYVNECVMTGRNPKDCLDETYLSQVVAEIE